MRPSPRPPSPAPPNESPPMRTLPLAPFLAAALCGALTAQSPGQVSGGPLRADEACYDVRHVDLGVRVDPVARTIAGAMTMTATVVTATRRVGLDLDDDLTVDAVRVDGEPVAFERPPLRIDIPLTAGRKPGDELTIAVDYHGAPRVAPNPPWKGGFTWARTRDGSPWIATSCQGEGADLWWPCKDHPSDEADTFDLHVTVPKDLVCASNGTLRSVTQNDDATRTFHWHIANPINNYTVALNIAPYEVIEDTYTCVDGTELPVFFWALPENRARAEKALPEFLDHLHHLETVCGPYPFRNEKYGVVETPHLGMEHQTIIAYGNRYRHTGFDYDWLHHHELSHEWWGNLVTCRDWKDMWIHEGIGTYMQALYIEQRFGAEGLRIEMGQKRRTLANRTPIAPRESRDSEQIYFGSSGNDIYYKGSWVCHTLRYLLGDETFSTVLRRWAYPDSALEKVTDGSQCRFTDTDELIALAERTADRELGWFFEVYLRRGPLPVLHAEADAGVLTLRWSAPDDLPFPMPVPVRIGDAVRRIEMADGEARVEVGTAPWEIDPDGWLLMRSADRSRR
ncbi:MAG: M1 family metallopeptidase [Planctomycetes bacterium]|nr:M1 family metallopeptidase [Planctomycetota bacterium]